MEIGHLAGLSGLGRELDRLAKVRQTPGVTEVRPSHAPVAERPCRAWQSELLGEFDRARGNPDRVLGPVLERLDAGDLGQCGDQAT